MSLSLERIEALAPDQASLAAARKLLKPSNWPTLRKVKGLFGASAKDLAPLLIVLRSARQTLDISARGPSRKFPCKHSLALMWMRADKSATFTPASVPNWVKDWLSRRRGSSTAVSKTEEETEPKVKPSIRLTDTSEKEEKPDPKTEQRTAAARERNRLEYSYGKAVWSHRKRGATSGGRNIIFTSVSRSRGGTRMGTIAK